MRNHRLAVLALPNPPHPYVKLSVYNGVYPLLIAAVLTLMFLIQRNFI